MSKKLAFGVCKLTGRTGKFVESHLIPKALTKPAIEGRPFVEFGLGRRPTRRWSSWYDRRLVIRKGEDILASYDNWAIKELRRQKLVWSGWGEAQTLAGHYTEIAGTPHGIRTIESMDLDKLRLFFLSLLWRAAATERSEFSDISIPNADLKQLGHMLLSGNPGPHYFYPIQLAQLSTLGFTHNHGPINDVKTLLKPDGQGQQEIPIIRFYFDGLIAHIHKQTKNSDDIARSGPLTVGNDRRLAVFTITYEASLQRLNLEQVVNETLERWPEFASKL